MKKHNFPLYKIFVYVALITLAISIIVPIAWVFLASLKSQLELVSGNPFDLPKQILWSNFADAFVKARMGDYLLNTIIVTALSLVILLVVALPASYVLARFDFVGKKFFNGLFMAGLFWLSVVYAATALPFTIYLLTGYFKTLPKAYEEAARIDGCGYFKTMTKIMIPMARPSIITVILFQFLAFWNEYIIAFTFMDKENATLAVGVKYLMADAKSQANFGVMYAGLVIVMIPTLCSKEDYTGHEYWWNERVRCLI